MSETTTTAPEQPAQVAQTSSEKKDGASNTSQSEFARRLAGKQATPPSLIPAPVQAKVEAKAEAAPVTEAAQATSAEVKETEAKEGETPPEEAEAETEEVPSNETQTLDPKAQAIFNRRLGKEVAKTKREIAARVAAEARAQALEAQLAQQPTEVEKEVHVLVLGQSSGVRMVSALVKSSRSPTVL